MVRMKLGGGKTQMCVSVPITHREFCEQNGLSPSRLLQNAIEEKMKYQSGEILDSNASLVAKISRISDNMQKYVDFIEKKGLMAEFIEQPIEEESK